MKNRFLQLILIPILLISPLFTTPIEVDATKKLEKPNIVIDETGKVDVKEKNGTVKSKSRLVTDFIKKYRVVVAGISGIGTVSMILFFILGFMRLGATGDNPEARSKTIAGLVCSAIAAAGLGAVTFITGIFMNAL